jgi:hypothetical protein
VLAVQDRDLELVVPRSQISSCSDRSKISRTTFPLRHTNIRANVAPSGIDSAGRAKDRLQRRTLGPFAYHLLMGP